MAMGSATKRADAFKQRTRDYAVRILRLVEAMPATRTGDILGRQLVCSATSVGANYRAACRARSRKDFLNKLGIVEEELDECLYWLDLIEVTKAMNGSRLEGLKKEADELLAMTVASIRTARANAKSEKRNGSDTRLVKDDR